MTAAKIKKLVEILQGCTRAFQIHKADGFLFAFVDLRDLTAFCSPSLRKVGSEYLINYELGLAVVEDRDNRIECFKQKIANYSYVILPRILPVEAIDETVTDGHEMKEWLADRLYEDLRCLSLPSGQAIAALDEQASPFIEKLKRVYKAEFDELISNPLRALHDVSKGAASVV